MPELARLALLLIALAALVNLARGTFRQWLRAKFLGESGGIRMRLTAAQQATADRLRSYPR